MNQQSFFAKRLQILNALIQIRRQLLIISKEAHEINDEEILSIVRKAKIEKVYNYTEKISVDIRNCTQAKNYKPDRV